MKIIAYEDWELMTCRQKTLSLEEDFPVNERAHQRKKVCGIGTNDASYLTQPKIDKRKVVCPAYRAWTDMLRRAYSAKFHANHKAYSGVAVCEQWHSFSAFRKWWLEHQVDGWQIDKDLISNSRRYSPEACTFVPRWLNVFANRRASSDNHKTGAHLRKDIGRFMSYCKNPFTGKLESLGHFDDASSAHNAWLSRKLEFSERLKPLMDEIDERIYPRIVDIINCAT